MTGAAHDLEVHPGWTAAAAPELWTQRVVGVHCAWIRNGGCRPDLEEATLMKDDWQVLPPAFDHPGLNVSFRSSKFLNFRGQQLAAPARTGHMNSFFRDSGYVIQLGTVPRAYEPGDVGYANRSAARDLFRRLKGQSGFTDDAMRVLALTMRMVNNEAARWLIAEVTFEMNAMGQLEAWGHLQQGEMPRCEFNEPIQQEKLETLTANIRAAIAAGSTCGSEESCHTLVEELQFPPFECRGALRDEERPVVAATLLSLGRGASYPFSQGHPWIVTTLVCLAIYMLFEELVDVAVMRFSYFLDPGQCMDLVNILLVFALFGFSIVRMHATPLDGMSWLRYADILESERDLAGTTIFFFWLRLLSFLSRLHWRMRALLRTVTAAWLDILFFIATFSVLILAFTVSFHVWLGDKEVRYKSIGDSLKTLFSGLIGNVDAAVLLNNWWCLFGYIAFVVSSVLIFVNVFIAIINKSFLEQQEAQAAIWRGKGEERKPAEERRQGQETEGARPKEGEQRGAEGARPKEQLGTECPRLECIQEERSI
mmetsp:Transcript_107362/g.303631  ORF Transcript_107362/g.303631 Transcript_107362/m.303631 type:complete len:538 (-) Transcript_107362:55-1668(-)